MGETEQRTDSAEGKKGPLISDRTKRRGKKGTVPSLG